MAIRSPSLAGAILCIALHALPAWADETTDTVRLAATGQFDQLEALLEQKAATTPLGTRDQHALCYAYSKTKRYDQLLPCLERVESLVAKGDRRTRLFGLDDATPSVRLMRAEALLELGQYSAAVAAAKDTLKWLKDEDSNDRDMEINALATLVVAAVASGKPKESAEPLAALEKLSVTFPLFDDYGPAKAFALARSYAALGQFQKAIDVLEGDRYFKLRSFLDNLVSGATFQGVSYWMWTELPRAYLLAKCRLELGRHAQAKEDLDRLLALPAAAANGEIHWLMLYDRGRIAEQDGELDAAIRYHQQAIEIIELQRSSITTEINKIGFVADKQAVYARLVAVALKAKRHDIAFETAERSKSRALVDLLAAKDELGAGSAPVMAQLGSAEKEIKIQHRSSPEKASRARGRLSSQISQLRRNQPELASLITVTAIPVSEIRHQLRSNEVLIEFYGSASGLVAFVVSPQDVQSFPLDNAGLDAEVRSLRAAMDLQDKAAITLGTQLYRRLLGPLESAIQGRDLLIIPHDILHYLPFAALSNAKGYLAAQTSVRILPSASVLPFLGRLAPRAEKNTLIFGNPDVGDPRLDLPSAEAEAKRIASQMRNSQLLTRAAATESAFKAHAPKHRFIHVASHGQFNAANALASRLLLAKSSSDDGSLTVGELYSLRLTAELVVLSACQTGLGQVVSGDDLVGLTRGFLYAGVDNIVASLWEVDDEATAELMTLFYQGVSSGLDKRLALRQAQNKLREKYPHPFFWAAFYLTGSGN